MLKVENIVKDYISKDSETVHALKGVSICFRRNEFVSILGPSGCGKTTFLNIIGGLDRYTSGDLVIEGKSTKNYTDKDWDTYRNHSIGFVFQSYNLIMHQSVLKNVELALTISGISKKERKERALDALRKVGIEDKANKKPNQLSGGQMQRIAIARALVNNPEILLADEPTGALDSVTSIAIMDLLKEVAKDRLVIMVTHNPELAEKYSTRIINFVDGVVTGDSKPYKGETLEERQKLFIGKQNKGKNQSSMGLFTAAGLSFSNLLSKLKRTILVSIAGSIGIVGVSAVLAVSQGVRDYISSMQDDMLSNYPVQISETALDTTTLMEGLSGWEDKVIPDFPKNIAIGLDSMITYLMDKYQDVSASAKVNDINEDLIKYIEDAPEGFYSALNYNYGIEPTNNIFVDFDQGERNDGSTKRGFISLNGLTQRYISELTTVKNFEQYAMFVDYFSGFMKQLPQSYGSEDYILTQYDLLGNSRMPKNANEMVLVVDSATQTATDVMLGQLGFYSEKEFVNLAVAAIEENQRDGTGKEVSKDYPTYFTFDDIFNKKFKYYPNSDIYSYDEIKKTTYSFIADFSTILGLKVTFELEYNEKCDSFIGTASFDQLAQSLRCILTRTNDENKSLTNPAAGNWEWNLSIPGEENSFEVGFQISETNDIEINAIFGEPLIPALSLGTAGVNTSTINAYVCDGEEQTGWDNGEEMHIVGILKRKPELSFGCLSTGVYFTKAFTDRYIEDSYASDIVSSTDKNKPGIIQYMKNSKFQETFVFQAFTRYTYTSFLKGDGNEVYDVDAYAYALNAGQTSDSFGTVFGSFGGSNAFNTDKILLRSLCGYATKAVDNGGYIFEKAPSDIKIYPSNFASKDKITNYLDDWNSGEEIVLSDGTKLENREDIVYSDSMQIIISLIDTLITAITVALVAFTSLALVVSCFMIAVITYISVVERVKEIGIIRSIGGRKKDVSRLFITETFMTGFSSGALGLIITYIFQAIFNVAMYNSFTIKGLANLTIPTALIMLVVSILLSVLSGLVPSMKASHQDPVIALRSE